MEETSNSAFARHKKFLAGRHDVVREERRRQNDVVNNIAFTLSDSYKLSKLQTRKDYDANIENWQDFDILIKHALSASEKKIATRPYVNLPIGAYLKYTNKLADETTEDITILVAGQTLTKGEVMPTYKCYVCNHKLKLKGCPYEFPISSSNTSYSAKGLLDADLIQVIDTRNKFYIQRNKYTVRLWQNHKNQRICLSDGEVAYYYVITNMEDSSSPGMFTVTLTEDERSHLDGEYAWNEKDIDYSDLNDKYEENSGDLIDMPSKPILTCDTYQYVGKSFSVVSSVEIDTYECSEGLVINSLTTDKLELEITPKTKGKQTITVIDNHKQKVSKNIMVKEV